MAAEIAEANRQLAVKVDAFAEIVDPSDRIKVAVYAYWHAPEVSANQLAVLTVGKPSAMAMLKHFGSVAAGIACDRCGRDLPDTLHRQPTVPRGPNSTSWRENSELTAGATAPLRTDTRLR